jgi:hypothetical protein
MMGFQADEAMGRHISILYAKEDREFLEVEEVFRAMLVSLLSSLKPQKG